MGEVFCRNYGMLLMGKRRGFVRDTARSAADTALNVKNMIAALEKTEPFSGQLKQGPLGTEIK